jgi:hypothetical protein
VAEPSKAWQRWKRIAKQDVDDHRRIEVPKAGDRSSSSIGMILFLLLLRSLVVRSCRRRRGEKDFFVDDVLRWWWTEGVGVIIWVGHGREGLEEEREGRKE